MAAKKTTKKNPNAVGRGFAAKQHAVANDYVQPAAVGADEAFASDTTSRRMGGQRAWNLPTTGQSYSHIRAGLNPFSCDNAFGHAREAIILCQQAYRNFPLLRNVIDVMTELANSRVTLKGGNQKTRDFVGAWFDRIGIWKLKDMFFREFWRSGNVALYKFDADYQPEDLRKMTQVFGSVKSKKIPVRYTILNPAEIRVGGNITFQDPTYYKALSGYELERIKRPRTPEDQAVLDSLDPKSVADIQKGITPNLKLDPDKLTMVFYKKQPYEAMAEPFAFPVLEDIDSKLELKRIDMKIARMMDRAMLIITSGAEKAKGGINYKTLESLQTLFQNETVIRTLVADYTTEAKWVVPPIKEMLGKEKYEQLDKDIEQGLNAILFSSGEKFASTSVKVQVFVERLKEARSAFLNEFLIPEIKALCQTINAKTYPEPEFEELNLKDELQWAKVYTTIAQIGLFTAKDLFAALETGKLPTVEEMEENQKEYKAQRAAGLYEPLIGAPKDPAEAAGGRPIGAKAPQASKKVSPAGTSSASSFDARKMSVVASAADEMKGDVCKKLKRSLKAKELSAEQMTVANLIAESIMANEPMDKWKVAVAAYVKEPKPINEAIANETDELSYEHNVDGYLASILRLSKVTPNE